MIWIFLSSGVVFLLLMQGMKYPYSPSYDPQLQNVGRSWSSRFYNYLMNLQGDVNDRKLIGIFGEVESNWKYPEDPRIWKSHYLTLKDRLQRRIGDSLFIVYVVILVEMARRAHGQRFPIAFDPFEDPLFLIVSSVGIVVPLYWHTRRTKVDARTQGFLDGYAQGFQAGESNALENQKVRAD